MFTIDISTSGILMVLLLLERRESKVAMSLPLVKDTSNSLTGFKIKVK